MRRRGAGGGNRNDGFATVIARGVFLTQPLVFGFQFLTEIIAAIFAEQIVAYANYQRSIQHMTNRPLICRRNLDGCVGLTGGRAANQKRGFKTAPLHFFGIENHLVQGRRNQPTQADDIRLIFLGGFQNTITVHHHAEIDHLVAIATEHHPYDVLTNVVHISFHGGDHESAGAGIFTISFLRLHERREIGHGLFHDARAFYHLRQKHLAGTEKFANHFHAVHQRPFDDLQWS